MSSDVRQYDYMDRVFCGEQPATSRAVTREDRWYIERHAGASETGGWPCWSRRPWRRSGC